MAYHHLQWTSKVNNPLYWLSNHDLSTKVSTYVWCLRQPREAPLKDDCISIVIWSLKKNITFIYNHVAYSRLHIWFPNVYQCPMVINQTSHIYWLNMVEKHGLKHHSYIDLHNAGINQDPSPCCRTWRCAPNRRNRLRTIQRMKEQMDAGYHEHSHWHRYIWFVLFHSYWTNITLT